MTSENERELSSAGKQPARRSLLRGHGPALLCGCLVTLAVELGFYLAAKHWGGDTRGAEIAALAVMLLWTVLAAPVLAAGASDTMGSLLRGGAVIDASAVTLLVMVFAGKYVTFIAAVKIYCTLLAVGLAGIAATRLSRSDNGRYAWAFASAVAMMLAAATPLWTEGLLKASGEKSGTVIEALVYANPFYSIMSAISHEAQFVWHQWGIIYNRAPYAFTVAPPAPWCAAAIIYGSLAGILAATGLLRRPAPGSKNS